MNSNFFNQHEDGGINFYVSYIGPLGGMGSNKRIKIDIARSEELEFSPVLLPAIITYSDSTPHQLLCYSLEEIIVEKLRSVMQRMQARDFDKVEREVQRALKKSKP